ncbi:MAG: 50S ribosomal protein L22 [bacterium]|nr:50S ribosomal protein L22 [bacterium]
MLVTAEANNLRISPRKVRLVAESLKGKKALEAINYLRFLEKSSASPLLKVLKSAVSNASKNNKLDEEKMFIKTIETMEGPKLKRFRPRSRGMAHKIIKRTSHVRVTLEAK